MIIATKDDSTIFILTGIALAIFHPLCFTLPQAVETLLGLASVEPPGDPS